MAVLLKCPRCHSTYTFRSRRRFLERFLLGCRPFRCTDCQLRFRIFALHHLLGREAE